MDTLRIKYKNIIQSSPLNVTGSWLSFTLTTFYLSKVIQGALMGIWALSICPFTLGTFLYLQRWEQDAIRKKYCKSLMILVMDHELLFSQFCMFSIPVVMKKTPIRNYINNHTSNVRDLILFSVI